ncbi:Carbonic anhydrase [Termitomyces sp. T112]|nr:Carbonic anhydrase [Termitomyces sp. T112]
MFASHLSFLILWVSFSLAHPVDYRLLNARSPSSTSTVTTTALRTPDPTINGPLAVNDTRTFDLQVLFDGNQRFRESRLDLKKTLAEPPGVMFIGCTDNRLNPGDIFQTPAGSTISQSNLANQFTKKDLSTYAAVMYAVKSLHIQHIIVLGHYGCQSVHNAMASRPPEGIMQTWLQPITDTFSRSRRPEIKKLIMARRWYDDAGAAEADADASRALVEENVRTTVKNLQTQSILSVAYDKRNRDPNLQLKVFVHGFVLDEESLEVKDLGISFGPPGQTIPKLPFDVTVASTFHNSFGKFNPKAKKLDPTQISNVAASQTMSSAPNKNGVA